MESKFEIETILTEEENYQLTKNHFKKEIKRKKLMEIELTVIAIIILLGILLHSLELIFICLFYVVIFNTVFLLTYLSLKKRSKKIYDSYKAIHNLKQQFNFYDDYFTVTTDKSKSEFNYNDLYEVTNTTDYYYLYVARIRALVLCKNKIKELDKFDQFIKDKTENIYHKYK